MQSPVLAAKVEQWVEACLKCCLLNLSDKNEMVAAFVHRVARAFEHRQRIPKHWNAMLAKRPGGAAEAIFDPGREGDRGGLLLGLQDVHGKMFGFRQGFCAGRAL